MLQLHAITTCDEPPRTIVAIAPVTPRRAGLMEAAALVDAGKRACETHGRPDLAARLESAHAAGAATADYVVVVGDFKQGKSSLVNALVAASVCPVDDNVATAVPTYVRHGPHTQAEVVFRDRRQPMAIEEAGAFAVEGGGQRTPREPIVAVDIRIPCDLLDDGLVLVDTPGVGGLGSAHGAANLAALSMADAVVFVTDAEEELSQVDLDFVRRARALCPTVLCVLTKTDFYPAWRAVKARDEELLGLPVVAVSAPLRSLALDTADTALDEESGFAELAEVVRTR